MTQHPYVLFVQVGMVTHRFSIPSPEVGYAAIKAWVESMDGKQFGTWVIRDLGQVTGLPNGFRMDFIHAMWVERYNPDTDPMEAMRFASRERRRHEKSEGWSDSEDE